MSRLLWRAGPVVLGILAACASAPPSTMKEVPLQYQVGPYAQVATLHAPKRPVTARQPALVLLHSGFFGPGDSDQDLAREMAGHGALVVVPAFRGEKRLLDGVRAEGPIEFCGGEVDDAGGLLRRVELRSDVDPKRIALIGFSHGACIALRLGERRRDLRAIASFSAPTDAAAAYRHLSSHPLGNLGFNGWLAGRLRTFVGGHPDAVPERWVERSPLLGAERLDTTLLLVHGLADDIIPPEHACRMRDALRRAGRPVTERHFSERGEPKTAAGPACGSAEPEPEGDRAARARPAEVWFFEGQGHAFSQPARRIAHQRALRFLLEALRE